jgi:hypothetical protein
MFTVIGLPLQIIPVIGVEMAYILSRWEGFVFIIAPVFVYLYYVYSYTPLCIPYLPHGTVDDMYYALGETVNNGACLCRYLPDLAYECTSDCATAIPPAFKDCSVLLAGEGYSELWIFWGPLLSLHLLWPSVLPYVLATFPFSQLTVTFPSLNKLVLVDYSSVTPLQLQCVAVNALDFGTVAIFGGVSTMVLYSMLFNNSLAQCLNAIVSLNMAALRLLVNAKTIISTSNVSLNIQVAVLSVIVGLGMAIYSIIAI